MHKHFAHVHARTFLWHHFLVELLFVVGVLIFVVVPSVSAAKRLQERSLYMNSAEAGDSTFYRLGFRYMSPDPVGSIELLFCIDPVPYHPCDMPPGLDVSASSLGDQIGETGFSILEQSTNRLLLTRPSLGPIDPSSSYVLNNVINPTDTSEAFAIRVKTFSTTDGTGPQVDFGSLRGQITDSIVIQTQVPPILVFCLAEEVNYYCIGTNGVHMRDLGELSSESTLTAQSQMAVGTNASGGFAIVTHGTPLSAGTNVIPGLAEPTLSQVGTNQFGINLVENTIPAVGLNPEGEWANAVPASDYSQPDLYKFVPGDIVAYSPNVSLMKKFTVSYIVNTSPDLLPGVYSTTVNYIATGQF